MDMRHPMVEREEYNRKMEAELEKWEATLKLWQAKADMAKADAKVDYESVVEELAAKEKAAKKKVEELKNSTNEAWREVAGGVEKALGDLKSSLDKATSKFSGQV